jgi:hypothetical protein
MYRIRIIGSGRRAVMFVYEYCTVCEDWHLIAIGGVTV